MGGRPPSTEKLAATALALLAVISTLYRQEADGRARTWWWELSLVGPVPWLPLLLVFLFMAINISYFVDCRFMRFDPCWIHRVGGSSCGIVAILLILAFVLKCKASVTGWEATSLVYCGKNSCKRTPHIDGLMECKYEFNYRVENFQSSATGEFLPSRIKITYTAYAKVRAFIFIYGFLICLQL